MLCRQFVDEFNAHARNVKFLTYQDELVLSNKLKLIQANFIDEDSDCCGAFSLFLSNLYHLLCQASSMKSELLENCLDILIACINSENPVVRSSFLTDYRFLTMLIANLLCFHDNEDVKLLKTLTIVRELLSQSCEMNEHNLKLITEAIRDYTDSANEDIRGLCFTILADLCMNNEAARYLINRSLKSSRLRENVAKMPDNLVSFKFFMLLGDVMTEKDIQYFLQLAFKSLEESVKQFQVDSVRHALDIMKHYKKKELKVDFHISQDDQVNGLLSRLIDELVDKIPTVTQEGKKFFNFIFNFFDELITLNFGSVKHLDRMIESAFTTPALSTSDESFRLLKTYLEHNGKLESSEIIIESLLDNFVSENDADEHSERQWAFLQLLKTLETKELLSEVHVGTIGQLFDRHLERLKSLELTTLSEQECFTFIYFLSTLSCFAEKRRLYYGKLTDVLELDLVPLLLARAHVSKREEIIIILYQLSSMPNFPRQKIASILTKSGAQAEGSMTQTVLKSLERRAIQSSSSRIFSMRLSEDLEALIDKINAKIDSHELGASTVDLVQLYRHKITLLSDELESVTNSLERSAAENGELQQKFSSFVKLSEKQEFNNWCSQLDNDRLKNEILNIEANNKKLKTSLSEFQARVDKVEQSKIEVKKTLKLKLLEIKRLEDKNTLIEEKLHETKASLFVLQNENETRINELKESLEREKKLKEEDLLSAIAEQKKLNQKLINAEKENRKLQDIIKLNEKEIIQMREKVQSYEVELKDCEQMKSTIMNLMQTRSFKK